MTIDLDAIEAAAREERTLPLDRQRGFIATTVLALVERVRELEAMEARLHETIADYEFLRRSYAETGDHVRAEMYAERIAQIETAMRGY